MLLKRHGDDAPIVAAQRVGKLASVGDMEGVAIWKAIAAHMDELIRAAGQVAH
jgi:hypothetical protein